MAYDSKAGKMKPNTTAPAKARSKTAGPSGSFPVGDKKHAILAQQLAPRSYNAGHISKSEEESIIRKAKAAERAYTKPAPARAATTPRKAGRGR